MAAGLSADLTGRWMANASALDQWKLSIETALNIGVHGLNSVAESARHNAGLCELEATKRLVQLVSAPDSLGFSQCCLPKDALCCLAEGSYHADSFVTSETTAIT